MKYLPVCLAKIYRTFANSHLPNSSFGQKNLKHNPKGTQESPEEPNEPAQSRGAVRIHICLVKLESKETNAP